MFSMNICRRLNINMTLNGQKSVPQNDIRFLNQPKQDFIDMRYGLSKSGVLPNSVLFGGTVPPNSVLFRQTVLLLIPA